MKRKIIETGLAVSSWAGLRTVTPCRPVIILYHGISRRHRTDAIDAEVFEQHLAYLKKSYNLIHPQDYSRRRKRTGRSDVLVTFDDGFKNNFEVAAPLLRKHQVPAIFFVSSRHSKPGTYLWPTYFGIFSKYFPEKTFEFRNRTWDMRKPQRAQTLIDLKTFLLSLKPHPIAINEAMEKEFPALEDFISLEIITDDCTGMTEEHIRDLKNDSWITLGGHTIDHPDLTLCSKDEIFRQICENKKWLEGLTQKSVDTFAYPFGLYNQEVIQSCKKAGYDLAYAVSPRKISDKSLLEKNFEIPRIGIYSQSTNVLGLKALWGNVLRNLGLNVG